jgi:hypothetical protein
MGRAAPYVRHKSYTAGIMLILPAVQAAIFFGDPFSAGGGQGPVFKRNLMALARSSVLITHDNSSGS